MKKILNKIILSLLLIVSIFTFVACDTSNLPVDEKSEEEIVVSVLNNIAIKYADGDSQSSVTKDLELSTLSVDGCTITWASNNTDAITAEGKVTQIGMDVDVKLTVTVTLNDTHFSKTITLTVKQISDEPTEEAEEGLTTIANILALAAKDEASTETYKVKGTITEVQNAIYGNIVISDGNKTLLVYGLFDNNGNRYDAMEDKPVVGDTIIVSGPYKTYNEVNELYNATLVKLTKGEGGEENPDTPSEGETPISTILALDLAEDTKSTEEYTVRGTITEVQNTTYGNVVISDGTNTLLLYGLFDENGNRYDALEYKPVVGDTVVVTGIVQNYKGSYELVNAIINNVIKAGQGEDTPDTPSEDIQATIAQILALTVEDGKETTDKYVVTGEITKVNNAIFGNVIISDGTNELNVYGIYDAEGNRYDALSYQPTVGDTITVKGVVKNFGGTYEIYNSVLVSYVEGEEEIEEALTITIADLLKLTVNDGETLDTLYRVTGEITLVQNATYGNIYITDGTNSLLVYGLYDADGNQYDTFEFKPDAGDSITITGFVKNYKGAYEIVEAILESYEEGEETTISTKTISEVLGLSVNTVAQIEGTVIATHSKGFLVQDTTGTILVYMNYKTFNYVVGDTVKVQGALVTYHSRNQFDYNATIEKTGTVTYTNPQATVLDSTAIETEITTPTMGKFVEITGTLAIDGSYYDMTIEGTEKQVGITYPLASLSLGLLDGKKIKIQGYVLDTNDEKTMLNVLVVSVECLEVIQKATLPVTYDFKTTKSSDTTLPSGWTWIKASKGSYATLFQSFRSNGDGIQSEMFTSTGNLKVSIHYYLNNFASGKTCSIKVTGYKEDGTAVANVSSDNLNTSKTDVAVEKDMELTLVGSDFAYITVEFVKDGGGNIGFSSIKIENVQ